MLLRNKELLIDYLNIIMEENTIETKKEINKIKEKYKKKRELLDKNKDTILDKLQDIGKDFGEGVVDEVKEKVMDEIEEKKERAKQLFYIKKSYLNAQQAKEIDNIVAKTKKKSLIISGLALASMLIYTAFKVYKDTSLKYQKKCSTKKSYDREKCILENRIIALKNRLKFLNNVKVRCNKTDDPVKCKDKLDEEILKVKNKLNQQMIYLSNKITRRTEIGY